VKFEDKYFIKFKFSPDQIKKNLQNAERDIEIARKDEFLDVKFNYAYTALLKLGIAVLSFYQKKVKSAPGHHVKIIDKLSEILKDEDIADLGNRVL
jgi:phage-related protein